MTEQFVSCGSFCCFSAVNEEDPYSRIKSITRWYIAGFYKKPKVSLVNEQKLIHFENVVVIRFDPVVFVSGPQKAVQSDHW